MTSRTFTAARRRLTALRLTALGISDPTSAAGDVPRTLLAMQAQDYPGALWSVGLRSAGATVVDVERAHHRGRFVRSWPMRGTLHFVRADDLGWMLELTAARVLRSAAGRHRQLGLDESDFDHADRVARDRLTGSRRLSRRDLLAAFGDDGLSPAGQRGPHLLGALAMTGVIVLVSQNDYALLDEVVAEPRVLARAAALQEFAERYFLSHGPATVKDFAWWTGLTLGDARAGLAAARDQLDELDIDGESYYLRPGLEEADAAVHVLPGFDEYILGYADRSAPLAGAGVEVVAPGKNGMFLATVVVDGRVAGFWKRTLRAKRVDIRVEGMEPLSATVRRRIGRAFERYGDYLGMEAAVEFAD